MNDFEILLKMLYSFLLTYLKKIYARLRMIHNLEELFCAKSAETFPFLYLQILSIAMAFLK
jgi:hypothetical protein